MEEEKVKTQRENDKTARAKEQAALDDQLAKMKKDAEDEVKEKVTAATEKANQL